MKKQKKSNSPSTSLCEIATIFGIELDKEKYHKIAYAKIPSLGDWGIYDMKILQITRVDEKTKEPISASDGSFEICSSDLKNNFFPLTTRNVAILESFNYYYDQLRGYNHLNFPDIHRHFTKSLYETLNLSYDDEKINDHLESIKEFTSRTKEHVDKMKSTTVHGIRILK